jgi:hypothetical protein
MAVVQAVRLLADAQVSWPPGTPPQQALRGTIVAIPAAGQSGKLWPPMAMAYGGEGNLEPVALPPGNPATVNRAVIGN